MTDTVKNYETYMKAFDSKSPLTEEVAETIPYGLVLCYVTWHDKVVRRMATALMNNAKRVDVLIARIEELERQVAVGSLAPTSAPTPDNNTPSKTDTEHKRKRTPLNRDDYEASIAMKESYDNGTSSIASLASQIDVPASTMRKYWDMPVEEGMALPRISRMNEQGDSNETA